MPTNPSSWEAEFQVQGHPGLHSELQTSPRYSDTLFQKQQQQNYFEEVILKKWKNNLPRKIIKHESQKSRPPNYSPLITKVNILMGFLVDLQLCKYTDQYTHVQIRNTNTDCVPITALSG